MSFGVVHSPSVSSSKPVLSLARLNCLTSNSFRPKFGLFLLLSLLLLLSLFTLRQRLHVMASANNALKMVSESNVAFGNLLYSQLRPSDNSNFVLSPFSLSAVMAMALQGAKASTADQMRETMRLGSMSPEEINSGFESLMSSLKSASTEGIELTTANKIYVENSMTLLDEFVNVLSKFYAASAESTDFKTKFEQARLAINEWVEQQTKTKIKNLLPPTSLSQDTRMVLVNAVYFKGQWEEKFNVEATSNDDFFISKDDKIQVPMMHRTGNYRLGLHSATKTRVLEVPYKGGRLAMLFYLPKDMDSFDETQKAITSPDFKLDDIKMGRKAETIISIPKFKVESTHDLKDALVAMGAKDMFDEEKADFSAMTGSKSLVVSQAIQKAFIEVNEEGSEAAAATGMIMMAMCAILDPPKFKCNQPFFFSIVDWENKAVLFNGHVMSPKI